MTNREWLQSLNNTALAAWLCDMLEIGEMYGVTVFTGIITVKKQYTDSFQGLIRWLSEEHSEYGKEEN